MSARVEAVTFQRAQRGWRCRITFTLTTARQFTDETTAVEDGCFGHSFWAVWRAYRRARKLMKEYVRMHGAKPHEREMKGWVA